MQSHQSKIKYRPDIDGLRAVAVLSVVGFHAFPDVVRGGFIGVDIFFVISGFLISTIIFQGLRDGGFDFLDFYSRRIKRIFPALFLVLSASYAFGWFALFSDEYKQLGLHIVGGAGFFSNFLLWHEVGYFDNAAETKPLLHLWSLGIEEQFYVIWPLLAWLVWKRKLNIFFLVVAVVCGSFYLNIKEMHVDRAGAFYLPQSRFWELACGSLLAWFAVFSGKTSSLNKSGDGVERVVGIFKDITEKRLRNIKNVSSLLGFLLLIYGFLRINGGLGFPGGWALVPVCGAMLIINAGPGAWINKNFFGNKILVWVGLISFPLYLWHWPLLSFARIVGSEFPSWEVRAVAVLISVALAWLTYVLVERPVRFGDRGALKAVLLVALMVLVGCTGYSLYKAEGYEARVWVKDHKNNKNELIRTPAVDKSCLSLFDNKTPLFPYCRFANVGAVSTVAIIGDSHAHVAYPGIAEILSLNNKNTLLLANSNCPPFLGRASGRNDSERKACDERINSILEVLISRADVGEVVIFTRGPVYITGTEPVKGDVDVMGEAKIPAKEFQAGLQRTIDKLVSAGKSVYYVTENPELDHLAESCVVRPLRFKVKDCRPLADSVRVRQASYLEVVRGLERVTLVEILDKFCPQEKCVVFNDGALLYADADHLSVEGSRFQAKEILSSSLLR